MLIFDVLVRLSLFGACSKNSNEIYFFMFCISPLFIAQGQKMEMEDGKW